MTRDQCGPFAGKHGPDAVVDPRLKDALSSRTSGGELPCAVAFDVAENLGISPAEVGRAADLLGLPLVKCQLGLFGYRPNKKIVQPEESSSPEIRRAIEGGLKDNRLPCRTVWDIAEQFGISKMKVSAVCDALDIKIKPCQLGAF
jgi:hypothetical protein